MAAFLVLSYMEWDTTTIISAAALAVSFLSLWRAWRRTPSPALLFYLLPNVENADFSIDENVPDMVIQVCSFGDEDPLLFSVKGWRCYVQLVLVPKNGNHRCDMKLADHVVCTDFEKYEVYASIFPANSRHLSERALVYAHWTGRPVRHQRHGFRCIHICQCTEALKNQKISIRPLRSIQLGLEQPVCHWRFHCWTEARLAQDKHLPPNECGSKVAKSCKELMAERPTLLL